ncbi:MAG: chromosome segregation ATPase [Candidatus Magnetoglobus multicellularis str. Araruama]|uniref:Chromosome segregation ATPase n=1 Tax=Candidatus Magnetoglobus multicellularis str. Araruama TaxID=890399 RepID=A0A1V1NWH7_9BACT|nr:MAG: chromosome segregation ATPase [Candidatus Magnetoglobus multicellularis str. Araruama]
MFVKIDFISKRNKTECEIYLLDDDGNRVNPLDDNGGGLSDIVSFSLRMASWAISSTDNLIVLDEPFKFLSKELRPLAGNLLKELSNKLNLQVIMVTHDQEMIDIADKIFVVKKVKGISEVEEQ